MVCVGIRSNFLAQMVRATFRSLCFILILVTICIAMKKFDTHIHIHTHKVLMSVVWASLPRAVPMLAFLSEASHATGKLLCSTIVFFSANQRFFFFLIYFKYKCVDVNRFAVSEDANCHLFEDANECTNDNDKGTLDFYEVGFSATKTE